MQFYLILVFAAILLFVLVILDRTRDHFNFTCQSQCISSSSFDGSGSGSQTPEDAYGCCDCLTTNVHNMGEPKYDFDPKFRKCMCKFGYDDFCFTQSTDFLLSQ